MVRFKASGENSAICHRGTILATARVYTLLYLFMLCLEYITQLATCILTPQVNAINGVT